MSKKFYFDTSVWRDYYENRSDALRPFGQWAFELIRKIIKNKDIIIYSDFVIKELNVKYNLMEIKNIFGVVEKNKLLQKVIISKSQAKEAALLCRSRQVSFGDALHAVLARDNNAIIVSRDKHFLQLIDIVQVGKPEDLI